MSFSADLKDYIALQERKSECCNAAFVAGASGELPTLHCEGCMPAFVSGAFLRSGTVTEPTKSFHFDIKTDADTALIIQTKLAKEGVNLNRSIMKNGKVRVYCKGGSKISDLLVYIGATKFALDIIELEVEKKVRTTENRKANAEYANIDRSATAAAEQLNAIERLRRSGKLALLSDKLQETARVRVENPFATLGELCEMFEPPLSKAGLAHRLRKLLEEAE